MEYTGERLIPGRKGLELLELEHRARYELAAPWARGQHVLDLGCGAGYGTSRLAELADRVVGIDLSEESVEYSRGAFARPNLSFAQGDVTDAALVDTIRAIHPDPFDLIVCFEVLEHVEKPVEVLARIRSLLAPSGVLVLSTPNIARPQVAVERDNPYHVVEYGEQELIEVLGQHFATVRLLRQSVHLTSRISDDGEVPYRDASWRDSTRVEAKYFVAICSDRPLDELAIEPLRLSTSDAHLMLLQDRLSELRKDQHRRGQEIERLRARVAELGQDEEARDLLRRQERIVTELVQEKEAASRQLFDAALRALEIGGSGDPAESGGPERLLAAAVRLREERDAARRAEEDARNETAALTAAHKAKLAARAKEHREAARALEEAIERERERVAASNRRVGELERQASIDRERVTDLARQVDERTAAGAALADELATERKLLAIRTGELAALRRQLQDAERAKSELERRVASVQPRRTAPGFVRYFADLAARTDEEVGRLMRRNADLEEQSTRLIREIQAAAEVSEGATAGALPALNELHQYLDTWRRLARSLAIELHHILTSRRWRFAMALVRIRNFVFRIPEGNPIAAHLNYHLRLAGQEPSAFVLQTADARTIRRRFLWRRRQRPDVDMRMLTEKERSAAVESLRDQSQETRVSVVMPTWNRAGRIETAIRSVQEQLHRNWELLIVDDGSTDDTAGVVAALQAEDERIRYLSIPHQGVSAARDAGLAAAGGDLIAYLDSDNQWHPDYLLLMVNAIRTSGRACAYAGLRIIDDDQGGAVSVRKRRFDYEALLKNNYIDINVFVHRRGLFEELGGFDRDLRRWVDWDLILRYTRRYAPEEVPVVLCDYTRAKSCRQITLEEPGSYKFKVLNKHLIDWSAQRARLPHRVPGMVSVVIPNFNLPEMTARSVEAVLAAGGPPVEVVVVDNGSDRRKRRRLLGLLESHPEVQVIETYENYGFALGCNLGAASSRGEFVVWLNNDTEVQPGWLDGLVRPLQEDPGVGIVGPKLLWPDGTLQHGGMVFNPRSKIPYHVYQGFPGNHPAVNRRREFQALSGACLALRAVDVIALGGFDPIYLNGCEDLDLCFRLRSVLHKRIVYEPSSVVIHYEGKTPGRSKNIRFNRETFVEAWGERVRPDDQSYFAADGFVVERYVKKGAEPDGPAALYHPELAERRSGEDPQEPPPEEDDTLRIGFVSIWYERGVSYVARQLALALEETSGFETHVLARWESDRFHNSGSIFHPRVTNGGDDPTPDETVAWARDRRLDAVVFVEIHPQDWKRVAALRNAGFKVLCYEHLDILRLDMIEHYGAVDGFVANSFHTWRFWRQEQPSKPVLVVPWGIPPDLVRVNLDRAPSNHVRFVHIAGWGGLNNRKNTGLCIEAFHEAAPAGARLMVYSQSPLETYGEACARIVESDPAISVRVGTLDDIWKIYRNADVLLWPSKREGLGLPILEALASGLPVIISDGWMMKEWPVIGEHALVCAVREGESGEEPVARVLPQVVVDRADLVRTIRELADSPETLAAMTERVRRDRSRWLWTWQTVMLAGEMRRFVTTGSFPADPTTYLPAYMMEFEAQRAESRLEEIEARPAPPASGNGASAPRGASAESAERADGEPRFLFIAGCQRSGTTALLQLLNADPRIVIGRERFKRIRSEITPDSFRADHFFDPQEFETNYRSEEFYERLRARWNTGGVRYIGDKVPFYYKDLFYLARTFPDGKILFLVRDLEGVAASYNARAENPDDRVWKSSMDYRRAVEDWNESLSRLQEFVDAGYRDRVFVVPYEDFFSGDEPCLEALYGFLGLPVTDEVSAAYRSLTGDWSERSSRPSSLSPEMVEHLAEHRDHGLESRCLALCSTPPRRGVDEAR